MVAALAAGLTCRPAPFITNDDELVEGALHHHEALVELVFFVQFFLSGFRSEEIAIPYNGRVKTAHRTSHTCAHAQFSRVHGSSLFVSVKKDISISRTRHASGTVVVCLSSFLPYCFILHLFVLDLSEFPLTVNHCNDPRHEGQLFGRFAEPHPSTQVMGPTSSWLLTPTPRIQRREGRVFCSTTTPTEHVTTTPSSSQRWERCDEVPVSPLQTQKRGKHLMVAREAITHHEKTLFYTADFER